jgi:phage terminase small subunit
VRRRTSAAGAQSTGHGTIAQELTKNNELIALEYLANGYNATAAYRSVHPRCSQRTAEVNGSRLLRKAEVRAFIELEQKERKKRLRMDGDEALEGITRHARADIRRLFKDGKLLPVDQWPEEIADAVKAIKHTPSGPTIVMYDKLKARELMAIASGALKASPRHKDAFDPLAYLGSEPPPGDE